jgi:hypothetical protein
VDPRVLRSDRCRHLGHRALVGEVEGVRGGTAPGAADRGGGLLGTGQVTVEQHHVRALGRQPDRGGTPDARGRAGHDGHAVGEAVGGW